MTRLQAHERYDMLEIAIEALESEYGPCRQGVGAIGRGVARLRALQAECWAVMCS